MFLTGHSSDFVDTSYMSFVYEFESLNRLLSQQ